MGTAARRRDEVRTRVPALARWDSVEVDRYGEASTLSHLVCLRSDWERSAEARSGEWKTFGLMTLVVAWREVWRRAETYFEYTFSRTYSVLPKQN